MKVSIILPGGVTIRGEDCKITERGAEVEIQVPMLPLAEALADFYANVAIELTGEPPEPTPEAEGQP